MPTENMSTGDALYPRPLMPTSRDGCGIHPSAVIIHAHMLTLSTHLLNLFPSVTSLGVGSCLHLNFQGIMRLRVEICAGIGAQESEP